MRVLTGSALAAAFMMLLIHPADAGPCPLGFVRECKPMPPGPPHGAPPCRCVRLSHGAFPQYAPNAPLPTRKNVPR
jgi:hypothetical protein